MIQIFLPKRLKVSIKQKPLINLIVSILSLALIGVLFSIFYCMYEDKTFYEGVWMAFQTITSVGYGDAPAVTVMGRFYTMIIGTIGLVMLGDVIAKISDHIYNKRRNILLGKEKNKYTEGYIILNCPGKETLRRLIKQWRAEEPNVPVCLVDESLEEKPKVLDSFENTHFISGNMLDKETYERANIKNNKVVVVYPPSEAESADAITAKIGDLVSKVSPNVRIICMLLDSNNKWLFSDNVTLIDSDIETVLVVQECQDQYTAPVIEKLLSNTEGANPETVSVKYSIGKTWLELQQEVMKYCYSRGICLNIFALIHLGDTFSCPNYDYVIEEGDLLSVIMYPDDKLNWTKIEKEIFIGG